MPSHTDLSRFDEPKGLSTFRDYILPAMAVLETIATSVASRGQNVGTTSLGQIDRFQKRKQLNEIGREKALERAFNQRLADRRESREDEKFSFLKDQAGFKRSQAEMEEKTRQAAIKRASEIASISDPEERAQAAKQFMAATEPDKFVSKTAFPFDMDQFVAKTQAGALIGDRIAQTREDRAQDRKIEDETRKAAKEKRDALAVYQRLKETADKVPTVKPGFQGVMTGGKRKLEGAISESPEIKNLEVLANVLIPFVAKKIAGEVGNLAGQEQTRAKSLIPNVFDTEPVRQFKLNTIEYLIKSKFSPSTKDLVDERYNKLDQMLGNGEKAPWE